LLSSRGSLRVLAILLLFLGAASSSVAGCTRNSAGAQASQSSPGISVTTSSPGPNATSGTSATTSGSVSSTTGSPGSIQFPVIAAASLLEPPSYAGFEPLPSFTYHHVDPKLKNDIAIKPAMFEAQLKILQSLGYHPITARELVDHQVNGTPLPDKPVMITFDDGWRNQYTFAWPLLKKYGFKATFFINPQPISAGYRGYLTRDMVVALAKAGNDIESHTWRHLRLTRSRNETALAFQKRSVTELTRANTWIAKAVGQTPVALCYPYGYYDLESIGLAQAVGYKAGFTVDEGVSDARPWDAFGMKRFTISNLETADSFRRRLLSGILPVTDIQPPPGSRSAGVDTTVSVNITGVPATITGMRLAGGPATRPMQVVRRGAQKYAEILIHGGRTGFHAISMRGTGPDGRAYYASWGIETGDK
jgi:peptidoglycan/xylan/chitin deacetylase (PgdA/CDA1 family)